VSRSGIYRGVEGLEQLLRGPKEPSRLSSVSGGLDHSRQHCHAESHMGLVIEIVTEDQALLA